MRIKNESVSLKIGKKQYDFHNLIMDEYLKRFIKGQLDENMMDSLLCATDLAYCLLKFDTPLQNVSPSSIFYNQDFDICIMWGTNKNRQIIREKQIIVEHFYSSSVEVYSYGTEDPYADVSLFYGKKVTAIGFNVFPTKYNQENGAFNLPVCSIIDVSNYNIYLQKNQEISVARRDVIETDAFFWSNNKQKVPGPVHLAPYGVPQIIVEDSFQDICHGILYSVGLSSYIDYIDKEYIIGKDVQVKQDGTKLIIKGIKNYLSTDSPFFCSENLYPSSSLYPIKASYKFIILKYKVWQNVYSKIDNDNAVATPTDTGYYYHMAIPITKFGKNDLIIKYERG